MNSIEFQMHNSVLAQFAQLPEYQMNTLKHFAKCLLLDAGYYQYTPKDIDYQIVELYKQHKTFQDALNSYLEYLFG